MNEGLITRIGMWLDKKWESKATFRDLQEQETNCSQRHIGLIKLISELKQDIEMIIRARGDDKSEKELADLKTRLEKIELYSGMTRKVDPTKPPVIKSAFQM